MVTKEMQEVGIRCKGQGFNCPTCVDRLTCVDSTSTKKKRVLILHCESSYIHNHKERIVREILCDYFDVVSESYLEIETEWAIYEFRNTTPDNLRGYYCHEAYITSKKWRDAVDHSELHKYEDRLAEAIVRGHSGGYISGQDIRDRIQTLYY